MDTSTLILPYLPENLESLHKQELENRANSILHINAQNDLKDHLHIVYNCLNLIYDFTFSLELRDEDGLTLQFIGIRLFNNINCSLNLLLSGYYQPSLALLRDVLETGFLLDFFLSNPKSISEWKRSDSKERYDKFKPSMIREALDQRDGFKEKKRGQIYALMCEYGTHPTYRGNRLLAIGDTLRVGPFFHETYLKSLLEELSMRVSYFTLIYLDHFDQLPYQFQKLGASFLSSLKSWYEKYSNVDLSLVDIESLRNTIAKIDARMHS